MALYTIPNFTEGIDNVIVGTVSQVHSFGIGVILMVFLSVVLGGSIRQKRRYGYADVPMWSLLGSLASLIVSLIMSLKQGFIQPEIVGIVLAINFFTGLWFFISRGRQEMY